MIGIILIDSMGEATSTFERRGRDQNTNDRDEIWHDCYWCGDNAVSIDKVAYFCGGGGGVCTVGSLDLMNQ